MQTPHAPVDGHNVSEKADETADASSLYHVPNPSDGKKEPSHYQEFPHYTLRDLGIPEQITISAGVEERYIDVPLKKIEEQVIEVPRITYEERIVEVPEIQYVDKVVYTPVVHEVEKLVHVPVVHVEKRITEIPVIKVIEKRVEVPQIVYEEKVVYVPKIEVREKVSAIPKLISCENVKEIPQIHYQKVFVDKLVEVPQVKLEYVYRDIPIRRVEYKEVVVEKAIDMPFNSPQLPPPPPADIESKQRWERWCYRPRPQLQFCPVPVEKVVDRTIYQEIPVPEYKTVEVPDIIVKKLIKPYPVIQEKIVEKIVTVEVPVEKIVPVPKRIVKKVERIVDVHINVPREPEVETPEGLIPLSQWNAQGKNFAELP